ncbi:MAG: arginine deiminase family protein [Chloroflexota bacterium]|nr:arginine deiminase family protein [Chloroflexota bacterium]
MQLHVESEHTPLRAVVMATPRHFRVVDPINVAQERFFATAPPLVDALVAEQQGFVELLERHGARVLWATPPPECPLQLNTRDIGVVVGDRYVEGRMRRPVRAREPEAVRELLESFTGRRAGITRGYLEGGDVLVDGRDVFVGVGERTDTDGAAELQAILGDGYTVHVLRLSPRILHLDVVLNLLPGNLALIYPPGLIEIPDRVRRAYDLIVVTDEEQDRLATNVLSLDERTVVADERNERVASILTNRGLDVRALPFAETTKIGGSFRCSTLPLVRGATATT